MTLGQWLLDRSGKILKTFPEGVIIAQGEQEYLIGERSARVKRKGLANVISEVGLDPPDLRYLEC